MSANNKDDDVVTSSPTTKSGCPVKLRTDSSISDPLENNEKNEKLWKRWFSPVTTTVIPASIEEAANHSQLSAPGQRIPLSKHRSLSSIPRGDALLDAEGPVGSRNDDTLTNVSSAPAHQPPNGNLWVYPSEQQFYNAMLKKGYRPPIESIPSVLQIHNAVNERSWQEVCKWERELHGNDDPKLVKFIGRPKDLSPKAWINSRIWMTQEPFDRHDWYVEDNQGGDPRRYVIDFYEGKERTGDITSNQSFNQVEHGEKQSPMMRPPSMYIDARPALDTPAALVNRMTMFMREALPGIASAYDSYKMSSTVYKRGSKDPSEGTE